MNDKKQIVLKSFSTAQDALDWVYYNDIYMISDDVTILKTESLKSFGVQGSVGYGKYHVVMKGGEANRRARIGAERGAERGRRWGAFLDKLRGGAGGVYTWLGKIPEKLVARGQALSADAALPWESPLTPSTQPSPASAPTAPATSASAPNTSTASGTPTAAGTSTAAGTPTAAGTSTAAGTPTAPATTSAPSTSSSPNPIETGSPIPVGSRFRDDVRPARKAESPPTSTSESPPTSTSESPPTSTSQGLADYMKHYMKPPDSFKSIIAEEITKAILKSLTKK
jgi:hypothetical protein